MSNFVKDLKNELELRSVSSNIDQATISKFQLASEDLSTAAKSRAESDINGIQSSVSDAINSLGMKNSLNFTDAQINAAKLVSSLAVCSAESIRNSIGNYKSTAAVGTPVIASQFADDVVNNISLAQESFNGMQTHNALFYSVTYNLMASRQDEFGEAFFPTITIDPTQSGIVVENTFAVIQNEIVRDSKKAEDKYNKLPLIKLINNSDKLVADKNKVIPVFRTADKALFLESFKTVNTETGVNITTAPLLVGKKFDLLGLSQTDEQLAKGTMDNTDSLDRTINISKIYIHVEDNSSHSEHFVIDAEAIPTSNFVATAQGSVKDMLLNLTTDSVFLNTSTIKQATGAASEIFTSTLNGAQIRLGLTLSGNANIEKGDVAIFGNGIEILDVRNAAGEILPHDNNIVTTLESAIKSISIVAYTLNAYRTNDNLRTRGQLLTIDRHKQEYQVPLRSGITMLVPINTDLGRENDVDYINSQIQATQVRTSIDAVKTLVKYNDFLAKNVSNGALTEVGVAGVGRYSVNPYYDAISLSLSSVVDGVKSSDREYDIRSALINRIKQAVLEADVKSNYGAAHAVLNNNMTTTKHVVIGTDPVLKYYITGNNDSDIELGNGLVAHVVSSYRPEVRGKIFVTFVKWDSDRNTEVNPLNFGNMIWAPTVTVDVTRTTNNATAREIQSMPRYAHIVHLPILISITVSDIDKVLGKLSVYTKQQ